jgi:hypothetical protein
MEELAIKGLSKNFSNKYFIFVSFTHIDSESKTKNLSASE